MAISNMTVVFLLKSLTGVIVCYFLYVRWPEYPFEWAMISVVLSLSCDNSRRLAIDRMIANTMGCAVGLVLFPFPLQQLLLLMIGVTLVITVSLLTKLKDTVRPALAAFVIVMLREESSQVWFIPLQRVAAVMTGCVVALLLTFLFGRISSKGKL